MTDYALGNHLWLKNPTEAPDLPRKQLLAHAFAAMQPPDYLWKKYLAETARLQDEGIISTDDYYVLRHSLAAKSALMDLTQGNDTAFSEGTIQEVLTVAKEKIRADLEEVVKREQESLRTAESRIQKYEDEEALRITKLHSKASDWARQVRRAILVIGAIIIIMSIGYTFPWALPQPVDALGRYSLAGILLFLLILSSANLTWGVTLASILDKLEKSTADKLAGWFLRLTDLDQGTSVDKSTEQAQPDGA